MPEEERNLVWLDLPPFLKIRNLGQTVVNLGTVKEPRFEFLKEVFPVEPWGQMFRDRNWSAHVFAPAKYSDAVGRAAREILEAEIKDLKLQREARI